MIGRVIFTLLFSCLLASVAWGADELRGKFVLSDLPKEGPRVPEVMDFKADGTCIIDVDGHTDVPATFQTDKDSNLTFKILTSSVTYHYCLLTHTLSFCGKDGNEYI